MSIWVKLLMMVRLVLLLIMIIVVINLQNLIRIFVFFELKLRILIEFFMNDDKMFGCGKNFYDISGLILS